MVFIIETFKFEVNHNIHEFFKQKLLQKEMNLIYRKHVYGP